jgi:RING-like zinc finger
MEDALEIQAAIPLIGPASMQLGKYPSPARGQRRNFPEPPRAEGFYSRTFLPPGYTRVVDAPPPPELVLTANSAEYRYTDAMLQDLVNYEPSGRIPRDPVVIKRPSYLTSTQMDKIAPAELLTSPMSPHSPFDESYDLVTPRSARAIFGRAKSAIVNKVQTMKAASVTPCTPRVMKVIDENSTCSVCLESFVPGCTIRTLSCEHTFHQACIDKWCEHIARCPVDNLPILATWRDNY